MRYEIELEPDRGMNRKLVLNGVLKPEEAGAIAKSLANLYGHSVRIDFIDESAQTRTITNDK